MIPTIHGQKKTRRPWKKEKGDLGSFRLTSNPNSRRLRRKPSTKEEQNQNGSRFRNAGEQQQRGASSHRLQGPRGLHWRRRLGGTRTDQRRRASPLQLRVRQDAGWQVPAFRGRGRRDVRRL